MRILKRLWPGLAQELWANGLVASALVPQVARFLLLRAHRFTSIQRCSIQNGVRWFGSGPVEIGRNAAINRYCTINHTGPVVIGDSAGIGPECFLLTTKRELGDESQRWGGGVIEGITIEAGALLGARVTVMPGVTIGRGALIGAGSVVVGDVPPNTVYAGVPAKCLRTL